MSADGNQGGAKWQSVGALPGGPHRYITKLPVIVMIEGSYANGLQGCKNAAFLKKSSGMLQFLPSVVPNQLIIYEKIFFAKLPTLFPLTMLE